MFTRNNTKMWPWLLIASLILVLDQASKWLVLNNLSIYQKINVMPNLNLSLAHNNGAAFGLLSDSSGWQKWLFISVALIVSVVIITWISRLTYKDKWEGLALACVLGGAIGNLLDRIRYGHVIDFIDFYIKQWHWYTFNIADIAICIGAIVLIILSFRKN